MGSGESVYSGASYCSVADGSGTVDEVVDATDAADGAAADSYMASWE